MYFPSLLWIFPLCLSDEVVLTLTRGIHNAVSLLVTAELPVQRAGGRSTGCERREWGLRGAFRCLWGKGVEKAGSWRNCKSKVREKIAVGCEGREGWCRSIERRKVKWSLMPKWLLNRHRGNRKVHGQPTPWKWIWNSLELFQQAQASLTGVPAFPEHCQARTNMRYWALPSHCPHTYYTLSFHWKAAHDTTMATVTSSPTMHYISKTLHPGLVQIFLLPCLLFLSIIPLLVISQGKMKTYNCMDQINFRKQGRGCW